MAHYGEQLSLMDQGFLWNSLLCAVFRSFWRKVMSNIIVANVRPLLWQSWCFSGGGARVTSVATVEQRAPPSPGHSVPMI